MGATPEVAVIDDLIRQRLDELLPAKIEEKLKEIQESKTPSMAIIATKGTLDWAYPPFILASPPPHWAGMSASSSRFTDSTWSRRMFPTLRSARWAIPACR